MTSIRRAFNSISSAVTQSSTASYLGTGNLVAANRRLTWVCYNDGPLNVSSSTGISGYTTDATRFITLTVAGASDVANGASQRHLGRAGTGTVVRAQAPSFLGGAILNVNQGFTVVEWLEIDGNSFVGHDGVYVGANSALLRYLVIHHIGRADPLCPTSPTSCIGINISANSVQVRNSIIYDYGQDGIDVGGTGNVVANTTIFRSLATGNVGEGIQLMSGTLTAENVISMANGPDFWVNSGSFTCNNCMTSDGSADDWLGTAQLVNRLPADQFVSISGSVDLHLKPGADAVNAGKDLSVSFTDDIDGQSRPVAAAWDIGADEGGPLGAGGTMRVLSGSYTGNGTAGRPIFVGFRPDIVIIDGGGTDPTNEAVIRTSTMVGDASKDLDQNNPLGAGKIQSLDIGGFTIGADVDVNENAIVYHWIAFKAAPGELELGSYTGTGAQWDMTRLGLNPAYVLVMSEGTHSVVTRSSLMPANLSTALHGFAYTDAILSMLPNGFRLGTSSQVNQNGTKVHYAAWGAVPGRVAVGTYTGNNLDNQNKTPTGFLPEYVVISRSNNSAGGQSSVSVHKPASIGISTDLTLVFDLNFVQADQIQLLQTNGFQVGMNARVNSNAAPNNIYYWAAFGPHPATTYYRSIGTAVDLTNQGTITVTSGSNVVTKTGGAGWKAANRGRGDRLTVGGNHYMIAAVGSDNQLNLASAAVADYTGGPYTIARQFTTLSSWDNCVARQGAMPCKRPADVQEYFPTTTSSLVADDRREVGIAYDDMAGSDLAGGLVIDNATTDATHTITLTADGDNRHYGLRGQGVVINNGASSSPALSVFDNFVTVEWMEIHGGSASADGIRVNLLSAGTGSLVQLKNNLIHELPGMASPSTTPAGVSTPSTTCSFPPLPACG